MQSNDDTGARYQMLQSIMDALPISITMRDTANRFAYVNRQAAERLSKTIGRSSAARHLQPSDFMGKTLRDLFGEDISLA
jgi:PAS domain-containing protein